MSKITQVLNRAMTLDDFRAETEDLPGDTPLIFACDYGDICHTRQVFPMSQISHGSVLVESAYSQSGVALADDDDEENKEVYTAAIVVFCDK